MLGRRFLFCLLNVVFSKQPHVQCLGGVVAASFCAVLQFCNRPFLHDAIDVLDCAGMLFLVFFLASGVAFLDRDLSQTHPKNYSGIGVTAALLMFLMTASVLFIFALDWYAAVSINATNRKIRKTLPAAVQSVAERIRLLVPQHAASNTAVHRSPCSRKRSHFTLPVEH